MTSIRTNLCFPPPPSLPVRVFMIPKQDFILWTSLEGFLYGKISVLFFTLHPCKEVQLIPGLGIYSGILVIYFQCQSNKSTGRTTTIVVYPICLLYVLSTVNFVSDLVAVILEVSNISICSKIIIFYQLSSRVISIYRFPLKLSKPYQPVVVISSLNVS